MIENRAGRTLENPAAGQAEGGRRVLLATTDVVQAGGLTGLACDAETSAAHVTLSFHCRPIESSL
jgi:hypothetical protein